MFAFGRISCDASVSAQTQLAPIRSRGFLITLYLVTASQIVQAIHFAVIAPETYCNLVNVPKNADAQHGRHEKQDQTAQSDFVYRHKEMLSCHGKINTLHVRG